MKLVYSAIAALGTLLVLGAAPTGASAQSDGMSKEAVERGKALYHKEGLCFACHGQEGKGLVGPSLQDDVWIHSKGTYEDIVKQILAGVTREQSKSGTVMAPKGGAAISDEDVRAIAAYVYSLSHP